MTYEGYFNSVTCFPPILDIYDCYKTVTIQNFSLCLKMLEYIVVFFFYLNGRLNLSYIHIPVICTLKW